MSKDFDRTVGASFSPSGMTDIPVEAESVTAFVGPAPRGPVDHAVAVNTIEQFEKQFGVPEYHCRMGFAIRQFFANGGRNAVVVRVSACTERNRIVLHGATGDLVLQARNPGPLEFLRASVDYDSIPADETQCFNVVVQRLRCEDSAWIDEQEYFRTVTTDPNSRDYIGKVLTQSALVRLQGVAPTERPALTIKPGSIKEAGYISAMASRLNSPAPTDYDLVGSAESGTGLNALETIPDLAHLCLISGAPDAAIGPVAMLAADTFCRRKQALLIVDPPARWQSVHNVLADQQRSEFASPNTVTWFPCAQLKNAAGDSIMTSATGAVAAALAEVERTRGMRRLHTEPMTMPRGGLRPEHTVSPADTQRLARIGINALAQRNALHLQLRGNVTAARHASVAAGFDELDMRARMLLISRRVRVGTRWLLAHEPGARVWRELHAQLQSFVQELCDHGLLAGSGAAESWYLKVEGESGPHHGEHRAAGFVIGLALCEPGRFSGLRVQHDRTGSTITELGWQSELAWVRAN